MPITALPPTAEDLAPLPPEPDDASLTRELTLLDATLLNAGVMQAATLFIVPGIVFANTGTAWLAALAWISAGALTWCGAAAFAELGARYPRAGGPLVFFERAYSPFWGFAFGWTLVTVIQPASIAAVAVACVTYLEALLALNATQTTGSAALLIMAVTAGHIAGFRRSATAQNVLTSAKIALLTVVAASCFWFGGDGAGAFGAFVPAAPLTRTTAGFGAAVAAALWAFSGWTSVTFVGGELREPAATLPRAMTYSVVGVTALTLLVTLGFLWALPTSGPADPDRLALDAAGHALGTLGERLVAMAVVVSCLAAISGLVFSGSRIIFAMARRGWFPPHAGATSGGRVPRNAMLYLGGWASVLTFTGRYDELFTYAVVAVWLFAMLGGLAVIVVRHRHPNDTRPYEVPGYPYVPAVFGVASWALMLQTLWTSPVQALIGAILVLAGLPVYWYFGKRAEGNRA
ncbi:MAG: amino acid permease [Vicinamibacterales bacterium]|nr:hypothetical protein [Acidobacteriota bacterium]MDP7473264.1 amino acid permease [Vicinamibacterales bacterium]MDP7671326.1 amino acid permease [Vicinamibacterales bacterium]HJO38552.1 amino acid permease [Vicinamibacterales bacterium]